MWVNMCCTHPRCPSYILGLRGQCVRRRGCSHPLAPLPLRLAAAAAAASQPPAVGSGEGRERLYFNAPLWVGDLEKQLAEQECEVQPPPLRAALPCRRARGDLNKALGEAAGGAPLLDPHPGTRGHPRATSTGSQRGQEVGASSKALWWLGRGGHGTRGHRWSPGHPSALPAATALGYRGGVGSAVGKLCHEFAGRRGGRAPCSPRRGLSDIISIIQSLQACALCRLQAETRPGYSQPKAASFWAAAPSRAEDTAIN